MKKLIVLLFACLCANGASASIYHGIFAGTVGGLSEFAPFNDGDSFLLRFEVDTVTNQPMFVGLDIESATGTFGNSFIAIDDFGTQEIFTIVTALDSPANIFDGSPESDLYVEFNSGADVFSGTSLAQPFTYADFNTLSGSFAVNAGAYRGDLNFTSGSYMSGSLPQVPLPAAVWLFGSGLCGLYGLIVLARRRST